MIALATSLTVKVAPEELGRETKLLLPHFRLHGYYWCSLTFKGLSFIASQIALIPCVKGPKSKESREKIRKQATTTRLWTIALFQTCFHNRHLF